MASRVWKQGEAYPGGQLPLRFQIGGPEARAAFIKRDSRIGRMVIPYYVRHALSRRNYGFRRLPRMLGAFKGPHLELCSPIRCANLYNSPFGLKRLRNNGTKL